MQTVIIYKTVELVVDFKISGKNIEATHDSPPEFEEIEITAVMAGDVDILPMLLDVQEEDIYEMLLNKLYA